DRHVRAGHREQQPQSQRDTNTACRALSAFAAKGENPSKKRPFPPKWTVVRRKQTEKCKFVERQEFNL
ncbi:MAG: hypothetical protein LUF68_01815, partial [Clostridiales bacterium]|nr:hypothetical protein [Clostridiales bacterium]